MKITNTFVNFILIDKFVVYYKKSDISITEWVRSKNLVMTYAVEQNEPRFIHEDSIISGTLHIPKRFTIRNRDALFIYRYI